ncbi:MAG: O-antigen ligase family protein [Terriglobia bacterium]
MLVFGGTEPLFFSLVQVLLLGLGVLLVVSYGNPGIGKPGFPVAIPLFLVALVLLQIVPLPASIVELFRSTAGVATRSTYATLSVVPYQTLSYLLLLLTYLVAFYLTISVCQSRAGKKHIIFALLALGALEAFYGLVQYLTGWQPLRSYAVGDLDPVGTYINKNHFAGLLEMILPFAIGLAIYHFAAIQRTAPDAWADARHIAGRSAVEKVVFWLFLAILIFGAVVLTQSRMGILSTLASIFVVMALIARVRKGRTARAVLIVGFLSGVILLIIWIGSLEPVLTRFEALEDQYAVTGQGRWAIWQDTFRLIPRYPWLGTGFGTFGEAYLGVQTSYLNRFVSHAHNDYLEIMSDGGLIGGLLIFGSFFYVLVRIIRCVGRTKDPLTKTTAVGAAGSLVAILCHSLADFNLQIPANALVFVVVLGLAFSCAREGIEGANRTENLSLG